MSAKPATSWLVRAAQYLTQCDPRILYGLFAAIVIVLTLDLIRIRVPMPVCPSVDKYFSTIENLPTDKLAIIDIDFGAGNLAENGGQLDATMRHLLARGVPVAVLTWVPNTDGQKFATDYVERIAREMQKRAGTDYCMFASIMPAGGGPLTALAIDLPGTVKQDKTGTPIRDLPMMKNVRDIRDVGVVIRIAYMWDAQPWLGFVQGPFGTKLMAGSAAITSSTAYTFLDSGQLCGMLPGASGAAQYEQLLAAKYGSLGRVGEGEGTRTTRTQSLVSAYVVLAIIIGNIAFVIERRHRRREGGKA